MNLYGNDDNDDDDVDDDDDDDDDDDACDLLKIMHEIIHMIILTYLIAFIIKEMNFPVTIVFNMSQAICFVPAFWKDIKTYLTSYAYMQSIIRKFFSQSGHKLISNFVNLWKTTDHKPGNKYPLKINFYPSKQNKLKYDSDLNPELTEALNSL